MSGMIRILSKGEAARLTMHIKNTIESIDNSMFKLHGLLDQAQNSNAWQMEGFKSWQAYLVDLFDRPMRLTIDKRREVVGFLDGAGLSTRAIAPIVGASVGTVHNDREVFRNEHLEEPGASAQVPEGDEEPQAQDVAAVVAPVEAPMPPRATTVPTTPGDDAPADIVHDTRVERTVTGLDGKTYPVPAPKPREPKPVVSGDALAKYDAESNSKSLGEALRVLERISSPSHRDHLLAIWWPEGRDSVAPTARDLFTPAHLRDFATALLAFADELEAQP